MPVKSGESPSSASGCSIAQADEEIVIKASELQALLQRVSDAEAKAAAFEADLQRAVGDLNAIRWEYKHLVDTFDCFGFLSVDLGLMKCRPVLKWLWA